MVPILAANGKTRKSDIENFLEIEGSYQVLFRVVQEMPLMWKVLNAIYYPHNKLGKGYLARTGEGVK
jgi:hypothetical protein